MGKTRSKRPASDTRPARRSLVEFTVTASRAADDGLSMPPAPADGPSRAEAAAENARRAAAATKAAAPASPEAAGAAARGVELTPSDSAADMLVKIAKEYQSSILDSIRLGFSAALDHAKTIAETPRGSEEPAKSDKGTRAAGLPSALENAAAAFQAETLELLNANVATGLNYARELVAAESAAEIAELSGTQARRQCELMLKQAEAMKSLARSVAKSGSGESNG